MNINKAIVSALKTFPQAGFLDIGANLGMHALVAAQTGNIGPLYVVLTAFRVHARSNQRIS